jgi:mannan endo-1,4-beta-mannosidase
VPRPLAAIAFCAAWVLWAAASLPALAQRIPDGAFVRARGTRLFVGDRPFVFLGANFNPLHGERARAAYRETIAALRRDGMTVGRIWALGEGPEDASAWLRSYEVLRAGPEGYIEPAYQHLDRVLAEARAQGLRVILTLSNHWKDYGGVPMYLRWAGLPGDGFWPDAFYEDERVRSFYRAGLLRLLLRRNTVTGVRYADDPTILAWELMNESQVLTPRGAAARRRWIEEMARLIKKHDRNHLVGPGLLGYELLADRAEWVRVHRLPEIDYCDSHLYPPPIWSEPAAGSAAADAAWRRLRDQIDDRAQLCRFVVGKPLLIGEFGFRTDGAKTALGAPRARWFGRFVDQALRSGAAGVLAWIYEPFSGAPRDFGIYTDRPDTDDVREALRRRALRLAAAPPREAQDLRLSPARARAQAMTPRYDPFVRLRGQGRPHAAWQSVPEGALLEIPPDLFAEAVFERAGSWRGTFVHAYGAGSGRFTYRFSAPALRPAQARALAIEARLSSEWPGASAPPEGGSLVHVLLDGILIARLAVVPDDGIGRVETVRVSEPALLRRLLRPGTHTLTFAVPPDRYDGDGDGQGARGLCVYGRPGGAEREPLPPPPPPGEDEWTGVRLRLVIATPPPLDAGRVSRTRPEKGAGTAPAGQR